MTVLDDIIEASTSAEVSTADLLRKVKVVAHRLGAVDVLRWVDYELSGYPEDAPLPDYRIRKTNVIGQYSGPMRTFTPYPLVPPAGMEDLWQVNLREPLSQIQGLSEMDEDPGRSWTPFDIQRYEKSGIFRLEFHFLYSAHNVLPREMLRGILDIIRTKALDLALDLQSVDPQAGSAGGPTIESPAVSTVVFNVKQNIYGNGNNIATGRDITQEAAVAIGDVEALRKVAVQLGLTDRDANEFVSIVQEERSLESTRVRGFLERVRDGAISLAGGVASNAAATGLIEATSAFLGL
ncbi:hypothetical protein KZX37_08325 [Microbacterium sp. EYE_5]|uniref:AbiTii domain-containing protein n=1 Tax=unclassified Microbacterium TaxID=2609290 RepID=UPI002005CEDE|nr:MULTISPECIES: hypothetical protein [unclassified Microbacterium]MCK6081480.1 hypothetical protein [Microbacterium sp. EYE_382]MCK6086750.1 hypothetical protein [Microbacterium sp. EYE_384]MCK6123752.1 hypothetical protein [Microbacterium sp. EYE_80]MCK6126661.1 hypothetical protein [Microbacterium sp. EYE_79]MCK6142435.1 hypothetical protein [Microbacterium sp. EYE_39]